MPSVTVMVFTTHPLSVIPLNIKQLNIFPVPSLLAGEPTVVHVAAPYGYGYGYGYGLHHPLLVAAPAAAEEAAVTDARKKREADPEAEAEADPA